jgi:hypothetical protein
MSKAEANVPVDLSVMLGTGETFEVKGRTYTVKPIILAHIEEFMADDLSLGSQLFNVTNDDARRKVDKWMGGVKGKDGTTEREGYCFDIRNNPVDLQKAMANGWDIVDLKKFFRKLCDLSG